MRAAWPAYCNQTVDSVVRRRVPQTRVDPNSALLRGPGYNLEERVAEHAIRLGRPVKRAGAGIGGVRRGEARGKRTLADALDDRSEGAPDEAVDQLGLARDKINHTRRTPHRLEAGLDQQWIEPAPDHRIAACSPMKLYLARDGSVRGLTLWVEVGGAVLALDRSDCATCPEQGTRARKRCGRIAHTFQHEAKENVVEGGWRKPRLCQ